MNKILKTKFYVAISVAIITFTVFLPSLQNDFINWDDNDYVYENLFIRSLDAQLFKSAFGEFQVSNWHPLTWLSHACDYAIWGLNPLGHHLTNTILHALNSLIVVFLVMGLMEACTKPAGNKGPAKPYLTDHAILITGAATGLLFGLHPLHVESVAWVAERKDLLCAFFFLLTVITYTYYVREINANPAVNSTSRLFSNKYLFALGLYSLSLLSKPMAVTLPCVLLILDWYPFGRLSSLKTLWTSFIEKLPFFALSLISSILTIFAQEAGEAIRSVPLATRLIVAAKSLIAYLLKMIVPIHLVPYYPYPEHTSFFSFEGMMPLVMVTAITAICIAVMRKQKIWMSVWSYYCITLIPVLGIVQVGEQAMADRYTYLPSLGPFLAIGILAAIVYERVSSLKRWEKMARTAGLIITMTFIASASYATIKQIGVWRDSIVFWNYVIDKEPSASLAHNNLGDAYISNGRFDMAIEQLRTALSLKPNYPEAYNNLGLAYTSMGQFDRGIEHYQQALQLNPKFALAQYNLGNAYLSKGQFDLAIEHFQTSLRLQPNDAEAHNNLGNAFQSKGLFDRAIEQYRAALRLKPDYAEAHNNLGNAFASKRLFDRAIEQYHTALRLKPDYAEAHFNLGLVYLNNGLKDMARKEFELELIIKPDDYRARQILNSAISK
jgi:tetratricopeptide (TPR) repeat protein